MSSPGRQSLRALPWLLCFQFFVAEQVARLHVHGSYSMALNAISDLGALHGFRAAAGLPAATSPLHALMNASFRLQGVLIWLGAMLVRRLFPAGALATGAFLLFVLSGLALCVVGVAPEDVDSQVHLIAAAVHFLSGALAMLLAGLALFQARKLAGALSLVAGALALAATLALGLRDTAAWSHLGWQLGEVERLAAYPLPVWLTAAGTVLLMRRHAGEPGASGTST